MSASCRCRQHVRAQSISAFGAIAVVAEHLKAGREALLFEPGMEDVAAGTAAGLARAAAVDVVKRQELLLALTAAPATYIASTVVDQGFQAEGAQAQA